MAAKYGKDWDVDDFYDNPSTDFLWPINSGEDNFEWVDLTELAAKKYPHLGDDCE